MMKTVSLETAKLLKEADYPQNTEKWWAKRIVGQRISDPSVKSVGATNAVYVYPYILGDDFVLTDTPNEPGSFGFREAIAAPTTDELLEALPRDLEYLASTKEVSGYEGRRNLTFTFGHTIIDRGYYAMYSDVHPANKVPNYSAHGATPAEALAALYLELKKQKII